MPEINLGRVKGDVGSPGVDGSSCWIKYNNLPQDDGATDEWTNGKNYIGVKVERCSIKPSVGYTWSLFIPDAAVPIDNLSSTAVDLPLSANMGRELNSDKVNKQNIIDMFYPVGTIYHTSDSSFDPNKSWSGTWVKIKDRFLLADGSFGNAGVTGGNKDAVVVQHDHTIPDHNHSFSGTTNNVSHYHSCEINAYSPSGGSYKSYLSSMATGNVGGSHYNSTQVSSSAHKHTVSGTRLQVAQAFTVGEKTVQIKTCRLTKSSIFGRGQYRRNK